MRRAREGEEVRRGGHRLIFRVYLILSHPVYTLSMMPSCLYRCPDGEKVRVREGQTVLFFFRPVNNLYVYSWYIA
jgi:hypothetical protein